MIYKQFFSGFLACNLAIGCALPVFASDLEPSKLHTSQMDFGGVGLMQMPSARMADEGSFTLGASRNDDYEHYYISLQVMPWLEAVARYTQVPDMLFSENDSYSGDTKYTDKGFDAKVRLWKESYWLPETSVGLRDIAGTGLFDGEYVVATKRYGAFDFTMGMGWGYLGQSGNIRNPLCSYSDSYCTRSNETKDEGGSFDYDRWFKGPAALFGGIEYQTPWQPLRLKLEYDGNDYTQDFPVTRGAKSMEQKTHFNIGALYKYSDWIDLKVSFERGNTLTLGLDFSTNFNKIRSQWSDEKQVEIVSKSQVNTDPNWNKVMDELGSNAGYQKATLSENGNTLIVKGEQKKYRDKDIATNRVSSILTNNKPQHIDTFLIVDQDVGLDISAVEVNAEKYRAVANSEYIGAELHDATQSVDPEKFTLVSEKGELLASNYSAWDFGISPVFKQSVGSPESFIFYNIGFNANAGYQITKQLQLSSSIYFNIDDNYDKYNYVENNPHIDNFSVPRVRTMFRSYVHDNPVRLSNLQLTWFAQPSDNIYTQTYGGYLETMFAGVGGEALYRRMDSNWAVGMDMNYISQRKPGSWFGTYSDDFYYYDGMDENDCTGNGVNCKAYVLDKGTTGMLSLYYTPQWDWLDGTLFTVSGGKFLGGDKGVRVNVSKQFKSGVIVGAYATKTDLTSEEYGEGSYNKGFYVSIPFDVMSNKPSTTRGVLAWQPITRDGGQTLERKYSLYGVTDSRNPWYERPNTSD